MKFTVAVLTSIFFMVNNYALSEPIEKFVDGLDKVNNKPQNISMYTGQFDIKDERGDDETSLIGIEHKNKDLFRDTLVGKFSPTTGG